MKNITVDARMINASGIGTVIKNILKRLIPSEEEWQFNILGNLSELKRYEFSNNKNVKLIECSAPIYSIREQIELIKVIPQNTDVYWAPHYNIPLLYKGKLIVTVHDVFHLAMPQFVGGIHKRVYARFMFEMVKRKADSIIAVSNFTASELEKYVHVSKENITVIYNGIDEEWFNIKLGPAIHNKPYILYVGNVKPHKNLITLVKAFMQIKDKVDYDLIIVGKKDGFITSDKDIAKFSDAEPERIIFTGYVEDDLLKQYYKQAAIFVFPSLYEGFGLPPLEALAAGCEVISSNKASMCEVLETAVLYYDPLDIKELKKLILELAFNRKENLNTNRYEQCRKFRWENAVNLYFNVINKMVLK